MAKDKSANDGKMFNFMQEYRKIVKRIGDINLPKPKDEVIDPASAPET